MVGKQSHIEKKAVGDVRSFPMAVPISGVCRPLPTRGKGALLHRAPF